MSNVIKYSNSPEANSLRVGKFNLGIGDVEKGPTDVTGYWNGITPPKGGYTIYINKELQGPSIYVCNNDEELVNIVKMISDVEINSIDDAFSWLGNNEDLIALNKDYESIKTDGLILNLDASFLGSYKRSGAEWKDISGNNTDVTLFNEPTFSSLGGGSIQFNGINNYAQSNISPAFGLEPFTISVWFKTDGSQTNNAALVCVSNVASANNWQISFTSNKLVFLNGQSSIETTYNRDDEWVNVTIVRNSTSNDDSKIYINGVLNATATINSNFTETDGIRIGMNRGSNAFFKGNISNVQLYDIALSEADILKNYNSKLEIYSIWLLINGFWNDNGVWSDNDTWKD